MLVPLLHQRSYSPPVPCCYETGKSKLLQEEALLAFIQGATGSNLNQHASCPGWIFMIFRSASKDISENKLNKDVTFPHPSNVLFSTHSVIQRYSL
jgi:hypothetical protein